MVSSRSLCPIRMKWIFAQTQTLVHCLLLILPANLLDDGVLVVIEYLDKHDSLVWTQYHCSDWQSNHQFFGRPHSTRTYCVCQHV
jgi:hypothetical protein